MTATALPVQQGDWIEVVRTRNGSGETGRWQWQGVVLRVLVHDAEFVGVKMHSVDDGELIIGADDYTSFSVMGREKLPDNTRCGIHGIDTTSGRCPACDHDRRVLKQESGPRLCGTCLGVRYIHTPSAHLLTCPACHGEGVS